MTDGATPEEATTVPAWLRALGARFGDREAVVASSGRLSYRDLDERSALLARGLLARGVTKGARIGLWLTNGPDWVVTWAAVSRIGAVAVPLSTFFTARELAQVTRHGDLLGVVTRRPLLGEDPLITIGRAFPELDRLGEIAPPGRGAAPLALPAAPFLRWVVALGEDGDLPPWAAPVSWLTSGAGLAGFDDDLLSQVEAEVDPGDMALMIYTSGSTAEPKGVPHTHQTVMTKTHLLRRMFDLSADVRSYTASPFFWVGGLTMSLFPVLDAGGTQLCTDRFDAGDVLAMIEQERMTRAPLYPHHLNAILEHPQFASTDRSSLREADPRRLVGDASVAPDPDALRIGLGMTETFGGYWWGRLDPGGDPSALRPGERRPPALDVLAPGVELKVVDPSGAPVADGERGEICLRGACITPGLHKRVRSEAFDADGFFHTGDAGEVDGRRVHFRGRLSDMIKTSGANVSPGEVVAALRAIAGVADAYVVALPDPVRGQLVAAAVVPQPGVSLDVVAMRATLRAELSTFKVPSHIEIFDHSEIPWTASHKVRQGLLADMVRARVERGVPAAEAQ